MKYAIPVILAFLSGLLLWQVQRERLLLDYEVVTSEQFPRESGIGRYFVVRLRNAGNREIREIDLAIVLKSGAVETNRFSQPALISQISESPSELRGRLPLLNPGETFAITLTGAGASEVGPLEVAARAPGATAIPRRDDQLFSTGALLVAVASVVALVISTFFSYRTAKLSDSIAKIENLGEVSKRIEKKDEDLTTGLDRLEQLRKEGEERELGKPSSAQLIFAVFNRVGLGYRFHDLAFTGEDISYWKTELFLMHGFLVDDANRDRYIAAAEAIVEMPHMAASSRGFGLYLLGKMEQFRGNTERAIFWFERCRTVTPLMHAHLMEQDPAYDLTKIREHLRNQRILPMTPPNMPLQPTSGPAALGDDTSAARG